MLPTILISPVTSQGLQTTTVHFCFVLLKRAREGRLKYPTCRSSEISENLSYKNLLEKLHRRAGSRAGTQGLVPSSLETCRALQSYQKKKKVLAPLFFHPEGNDDQVAFCTRFTQDAMTEWMKRRSAWFQGCRPCEPAFRASFPGSGRGFSPDLLMVTCTTLPRSPWPAVSR